MVPPQNPEWFGRYRVTTRIGTGGMAEVYLARHIGLHGDRGPAVAVKRLMPHLASDRHLVQMFLNEARITAQVQHPNVVRIVELNANGAEPFIAMELLEGRSFSDLRQQAAERGQHVPLGITLRVLVEACRGLDAAHRAVDDMGRPLRIVHRDFSPDNIHVGVDGHVKVIDFGIAKADAVGTGTEPGTLKGKFFYMSPEMILAQPVDHRADLFAAGVMLYEQLCGRRPFTGANPNEVLQRISEGRPQPPTAFDPSVPSALERVCLTALAKDPAQRFASLETFIQAIEQVGGSAELASTEQVAAYVDALFPLGSDPKRQALLQGRWLDPSLPGTAPPLAKPAPPVSLPSSPPAPAGVRPRRRWKRWVFIPLVVVLGGGLAFHFEPWGMSSLPPAERLELADRAPLASERRSLLSGLGGDTRATPAQLARAGTLLLQDGYKREASTLAEAFIQRFPRSLDALLLEARVATLLQMGKRAERALAQAQTVAPKNARVFLGFADLREAMGDNPGALEALATAYALRPVSSEVAPRYGLLLSRLGQLDEASAVLGAWSREHYDHEVLTELAFVRYRQGRVEEAGQLLRRALRRAPSSALAHYYLGAVLFRQGDVSGAERAYREAERLAPQDPRALVARCQIYARRQAGPALMEAQELLRERFAERSPSLLAECAAP